MLTLNNNNRLLDPLKILAGEDIYIQNIGIIKQPKLNDIKDIGIINYYDFLSILTTDLTNSNDRYGINNEPYLDTFTLLISNETTRNLLFELFKFVFKGKVYFIDNYFQISNGEYSGIVDSRTYESVQIVLYTIFHLNHTETLTKKYKTQRAKKLAEKIAAGRKKYNAIKNKNKDIETIEDIISSVCAKHPSYDFFNIWGITVFQLYDQYLRLIYVDKYQIESMLIATHGSKDGYTPKHWSQKINLNS